MEGSDEGPGFDVEVCRGWVSDGKGGGGAEGQEKWAGCNPALRWGVFWLGVDFGLACLVLDSVASINPCGLCRIEWFQPDLN